jgi:predicted nucleic acid-binding protein
LIVVDASLFVAWLLNEPSHGPNDELWDILVADTLFVPSRWPDEVASALLKAVKNKRIEVSELEAIGEQIVSFDYGFAEPTPIPEISRLARDASDFGLTVYDMTYLMVARDHNLPLATVDRAMRRAAAQLNIALLPA